ncbi:hypothetical protein [Deminuibacter soli]|uniref:Uncharacterized protein n=1 Tax=Deminuibacter soli TaxID=2291815 RepID=A0A3E1NQ06_9BACT|nr:hypothetical protein [Deminuibacter soli]RFM30015.1 hypothetical protein DXN05_03320 [Deminuibacter soli]
MKVVIKATVPTVYQLSSLHAFKMGSAKHINGSFSAKKEFDTIKEAREYLKDLADDYYEGEPEQKRRHLGEDCLTLDACTAYIEKKEIE